MRYVKIPEPILVTEKQQITFHSLLNDTWLNHIEQFGQTVPALRSGLKIETLFSTFKPGDMVPMEDADYERLTKAIEGTQYNPSIGRKLMPFLDAVLNAKKELATSLE